MDRFGSALAAGNFNGDGYDDLAVGVPRENIGDIIDAGMINVVYGSSVGLTAEGNRAWHQDSADIAGGSEIEDWFGSALAAGNFNGDGYDDLAVGVPQEDIRDINQAGMINVIYGSEDGLTAEGNRAWHQDSPDIAGAAEIGDWFGFALAAGNFNGDAYDDLAVGVPQEDIRDIIDAGMVNVLYGSADGLKATRDQAWHQNSAEIEGGSERGDRLGSALTACDFDGDGYDDLAIGAPREDIGALVNAGMVNVLYGSADGLKATRNQVWHQNSPRIFGASEPVNDFETPTVSIY